MTGDWRETYCVEWGAEEIDAPILSRIEDTYLPPHTLQYEGQDIRYREVIREGYRTDGERCFEIPYISVEGWLTERGADPHPIPPENRRAVTTAVTETVCDDLQAYDQLGPYLLGRRETATKLAFRKVSEALGEAEHITIEPDAGLTGTVRALLSGGTDVNLTVPTIEEILEQHVHFGQLPPTVRR